MQLSSVADTQNRRLSYGPTRPRRWNGEGASIVGSVLYEPKGSVSPCRERAKVTERVSFRQRKAYALLATDASLSGKRAERWISLWDKGATAMRRNILEAFIYLHNDSNAATIESDLGGGASLLFTRFTSWIRLSYKTFHSGRNVLSFGVKPTPGTGTQRTTTAGGSHGVDRVSPLPFSGTGTESMPRLRGNTANPRGWHLRPPLSLGAGGQEGVVAERERRTEEESKEGGSAPPTKATPGVVGASPYTYRSSSFLRGGTPTTTTAPVFDGPCHAMKGHTGKGKAREEGDKRKDRWSVSHAGKSLEAEAGKDTEDSSRSVLLLLLQAIIIFMRGAGFMTQFVEAGVASMLADCLECGTQSCPLLEGAPMIFSPYRSLSKAERKHVVLLLLYVANAGRVYRELIGGEASMIKLFHALQREEEEDVAILLTELFTSLGQGHPRMAPMIHSGLIRVILCHSTASERSTRTAPSLSPPSTTDSSSVPSPHPFTAGLPFGKATGERSREGERPDSSARDSMIAPVPRVLSSHDGHSMRIRPSLTSDAQVLSPLDSVTVDRDTPPREAEVEPMEGRTPCRRPLTAIALPTTPTTTSPTTLHDSSARPMARSAATTMRLPALPPQCHKEETNEDLYSRRPPLPPPPPPPLPSSSVGLEWLERTISDDITFHTARTLHYLQITMEEQHFAQCQKCGAGASGGRTSMDLVPIVGLTLSGLEDWKMTPFDARDGQEGKGGRWQGENDGSVASSIVGTLDERMEERNREGWCAGESSPLSHPGEGIHPHLKPLTFSEFLDALMYLTLHENTRFRVEGSELLALAAKNIHFTRPILTRCFEMLDDDMFCITDEEDKVRIACRQRRQLSCGRAAVQILLSKPMSEERKTLIIHYIALYGAHISLLKYLRLSDSSDAAAVHDCCKALQLIARASHAQQQEELQQTQQLPSRWICAEAENSGGQDSQGEGNEEGERRTHDYDSAGTKTSPSPIAGGTLSPVLQMGFVIHDTVGNHLYHVLLHEELSEEESFAILRAAKSRRVMIPLSTEEIPDL